jgi:ATP-binding cassette subfamily B multidrug efflux pump
MILDQMKARKKRYGETIKFIKQAHPVIILIVLLLIIQAVCDLSLPSYISDIVNVGIQQSGVTDKIPEAIRESEFNKLLSFTDEADKKTIQDAYTVVSKSSGSKEDWDDYQAKYPVISNETVCVQKDLSTLELNNLAERMIKPMVLLMSNEAGEITKIETDEQFVKLPDIMIAQAVAKFIKGEYDAVGIDTSAATNRYILLTGVKMLGVSLLGMLIAILVCYFASSAAAAIGRDLKSQVFKKVVSFSNTEFDKFSTASLITRSTIDVQQVQMLIVLFLRTVLYAPILGIGAIVKLLNTNTSMAWVIGLTVGIVMIALILLFTLVMPKFKLMQKLIDKLNLVTREILTGLPVIRAFSRGRYEEIRFDKANKDLTKNSLFVNRVMSFMTPVMMLIMNSVAVLIVWVGARSVNTGQIQVGDVMAYIQYTMLIVMAFLSIATISTILPRASVSAVRIDEILSMETVIRDPVRKTDFVPDKKGFVEFNHVTFRYPEAEEDVLHDITFTAKPGQTTAIIGSTGCGKSTMINLIPRFYDVTEGHIYVDGVDVRDITQHDLREKLGYVPQKGVLFSGNIISNILYGNPSGNHIQMMKAAEIAQAVDFIEQKLDKYKSYISQGGSNVSGGQKQRLSIARAIAKNPEIYIFDDSSSALDYKTDVTLRQALKAETASSTVIIVAQRISTILQAEQIIVLDEGKIVGIGSHRELLKNCEVYQQIAMAQLSKEELDRE